MPPKSIFRQPGAKHFQLVHRSLRDPLIHDPEASKHVLKEFERPNDKKGKSRADLEQVLSSSDLAHDQDRANIGEAAAYGIYFDDTEYDYMKHLRPVGLQEDGVDSILVEAPLSLKGKGKGKDKGPIELIDIPAEALPSTSEIPRNYESQQAVPSSISGFQPEMDPHLRQVLEALEDDEFVEDDMEDDFFGELVADGERGASEKIEFEFDEEGIDEDVDSIAVEGYEEVEESEEEGWEARFARFKRGQGKPEAALSDIDVYSDGGDTIGTLPQFSVIGAKKRRKGTSDASGYSMSSSSMFRNKGLTTLDEQFDQLQKEYDSDEEEREEDSDTDSAPELITSREDFDAMMNEFLDNYEIVGGKMKPVLAGNTAVDKLDTIRKGLGEAKIRDDIDDDVEDDILMPVDIDEPKDRWDCETILTTYSNLENHPRLIRARQVKITPKIILDSKTGLPMVDGEKVQRRPLRRQVAAIEEVDEDERSPFVTITRPKNESKEDKKARKQAVKAERQSRRADKKITREQYSSEIKQQAKRLSEKEKTKMRKL
ncbi:LTV-domain-containing protein [Irpex rosettiformis]|uniref:LTV-domain-containing protein n=1 Tax=Irpex rosettiformis TaxID=378272 RepID=A0ACB8UJM1_9APHY|nr:LTV-domain-containing protein [Irpex rosettiformis]